MNNIGLTKEIIHPQWGAPMSFHVLVRVEHDLLTAETYMSFASYYSKSVYTSGGMSMTHTTVRIPQTQLGTQEEFLLEVIEDPDNVLSGAVMVTPTV